MRKLMISLLFVLLIVSACKTIQPTEETTEEDSLDTLSGDNTEETENSPGKEEITCDDSDDGLEIGEKGTITGYNGDNYEFTDSCDGVKLTEYYCEEGVDKSRVFDCTVEDFDNCENGKCIYVESVCGNDEVEGSEVCDGNSRSCETQGGADGTQECNSDCDGWKECKADAECGDDEVNGNEECDGDDLDGETCESQDYASGTLSCTSTCKFDFDDCVEVSDCGNGEIDSNEDCDDGNTEGLFSITGDYYQVTPLKVDDYLDDVIPKLNEEDLDFLAKDEVQESDSEQELSFKSGSVEFDENYDEDEDYYLYFEEGDTIFEYHINFDDGLESVVDSDLELPDLLDLEFFMLGTEYDIDAASVGTDDSIVLTITGSGDTHEFTDSDFTDEDFEAGLRSNGEAIDEGLLVIEADYDDEDDSGDISEDDVVIITDIHYRLTAKSDDGDVFIPKHEGLRKNIENPDGMLSDEWNIIFEYILDEDSEDALVYIVGNYDTDDKRDGCSIECLVDPGWECDDDEPTDCTEN